MDDTITNSTDQQLVPELQDEPIVCEPSEGTELQVDAPQPEALADTPTSPNDLSLEAPTEPDPAAIERLVHMTQLSYQQELSRHESLLAQAGRFLTSVSILFAALVALLWVVVSHTDAMVVARDAATPVAEVVLFRIYVFTVILPLVATFITTLVAATPFKRKTLEPPIATAVSLSGDDPSPSQAETALRYCASIQESYDSCHRQNEAISGLLIASTILLIITVGVATVEGLVMMFFL